MLFGRQMWRCFLLLVVCCSAFVYSEEDQCPEPSDIQPCTCDPFNGNSAWVFCSNISDLGVLRNVFDGSDKPFQQFTLRDSNVTFIPSRAINNKNTTRVVIESSTLYNVFDLLPVQNHKVLRLEWRNSRLMCGNLWKQLKSLKELQILHVTNYPIAEIGKEFEKSLTPTLENFILFRTDTKKFSPTMFRNLVNLESVAVGMTRLSSPKRSMFPENNRIKEISFRNNMIKSLPDDMFSNMPHLRNIDISHNQLKIFSEAVFSHVLDIPEIVITLQENPISCDCSFKWVLYKPTRVKVEGKCDNPSNKKGRYFENLRREDFSYCD